jgi:hypothetical protein
MATGNLDQNVAEELLSGLFVGMDWGDGDGSRIFSDPFGYRHDIWVRLVAGSQKGAGAQITWGTGTDGSRSNTNTVTLVAPSTAPTHMEFYSYHEYLNTENTIAMKPITGVGAGATVVFNPGSIAFRWGKAKPEDGDVPDHSTLDLRETKLASGTLKNQASQYSSLGAIYSKFQHVWVVLDNGSGVRIASPDNIGNLTLTTESGFQVVKNDNPINITNTTGSTFVAQYVEVWVHGSDFDNTPLTFSQSRSPQITALRKQLSSPVTVAAGQAVNIPAGAFKVRAS